MSESVPWGDWNNYVISGFAVVVAFIALWPAIRASDSAKEAVREASESNRIAADANRIANENKDRATEPYDVEWEVGWLDEHHLFIRNIGLDPAHNARYRLSAPGFSMRSSGPEIVKSWEDFALTFDVALPEDKLAGALVYLRIVWTSPAGNPHAVTVESQGKDVFRRRRPKG